jgi:hypothetical protein
VVKVKQRAETSKAAALLKKTEAKATAVLKKSEEEAHGYGHGHGYGYGKTSVDVDGVIHEKTRTLEKARKKLDSLRAEEIEANADALSRLTPHRVARAKARHHAIKRKLKVVKKQVKALRHKLERLKSLKTSMSVMPPASEMLSVQKKAASVELACDQSIVACREVKIEHTFERLHLQKIVEHLQKKMKAVEVLRAEKKKAAGTEKAAKHAIESAKTDKKKKAAKKKEKKAADWAKETGNAVDHQVKTIVDTIKNHTATMGPNATDTTVKKVLHEMKKDAHKLEEAHNKKKRLKKEEKKAADKNNVEKEQSIKHKIKKSEKTAVKAEKQTTEHLSKHHEALTPKSKEKVNELKAKEKAAKAKLTKAETKKAESKKEAKKVAKKINDLSKEKKHAVDALKKQNITLGDIKKAMGHHANVTEALKAAKKEKKKAYASTSHLAGDIAGAKAKVDAADKALGGKEKISGEASKVAQKKMESVEKHKAKTREKHKAAKRKVKKIAKKISHHLGKAGEKHSPLADVVKSVLTKSSGTTPISREDVKAARKAIGHPPPSSITPTPFPTAHASETSPEASETTPEASETTPAQTTTAPTATPTAAPTSLASALSPAPPPVTMTAELHVPAMSHSDFVGKSATVRLWRLCVHEAAEEVSGVDKAKINIISVKPASPASSTVPLSVAQEEEEELVEVSTSSGGGVVIKIAINEAQARAPAALQAVIKSDAEKEFPKVLLKYALAHGLRGKRLHLANKINDDKKKVAEVEKDLDDTKKGSEAHTEAQGDISDLKKDMKKKLEEEKKKVLKDKIAAAKVEEDAKHKKDIDKEVDALKKKAIGR